MSCFVSATPAIDVDDRLVLISHFQGCFFLKKDVSFISGAEFKGRTVTVAIATKPSIQSSSGGLK